ncbi:M15 family metallopeptidase [Duganella qianjiadongensis]|uniref:M15 family peptidase n=1 Tax=Duganella qianjiadongensis TaxID=2692176 RepID=A0ABW9VQV0_9BURK|nr:M15 family metallopeptidase [Duganella qianjiadongensis]MYM41855.1 M15 family peptidase [Duganella qianjiadongensis]
MLLFFVLMAFLAACFSCSVLLFAPVREAVHACLRTIWRGVRQPYWNGGQSLSVSISRMLAGTGSHLRGMHAFICRRWLLALAVLVLLTVPVLLAFQLSGKAMLDGFQGSGRDSNEQVLALLQGEQLTAPVALPPLTFTTAEVVQLRPMLDSANRNWQLLEPGFSQRLLRVFRVMREQYGYEMAILEGYRSPERQNQLAQAGSNVTNARAFQSYHQFGLAADCAFLRDGKLQISEKDPWTLRGYRLYGEVAEAAGLRWGGRWAMMDFGHVELQQAGLLRK